MRATLREVAWPPEPRIRSRLPETIEDAWEWNYWSEHPEVEPEGIADEIVSLRHTEAVLEQLSKNLSRDDRLALEQWANAETEAQAGGPPEPSPGIERRPLHL